MKWLRSGVKRVLIFGIKVLIWVFDESLVRVRKVRGLPYRGECKRKGHEWYGRGGGGFMSHSFSQYPFRCQRCGDFEKGTDDVEKKGLNK